MTQYKIYHNPRCSKSRQTLALIEEAGIEPEIVLYLENTPSTDELAAVIKKLGISARDLLRKGEEEYKSLGLSNTELSDQSLIEAMSQNPRLIERPIVVANDRAVLGRPPENVLELIG
ncbi:MAG: arsenate reductase (glutaredoxin) [Porticoccaceae bacterium]|nr:arsenate reductase (glutaredoxin) [Porticoccaceae bacterium]